MNKDSAKKIISATTQCASALNSMLCDVKGEIEEEEFDLLKRKCAAIINYQDQQVVKDILETYPDLSPWDDDDE